MGSDLWRLESEGRLAADNASHLLIVSKDATQAHYLIFRRSTRGEPQVLLASGTKDNVQLAMAAAQRASQRLQDVSRQQLPS
jgi:hypothetical protein